MFRRYKQCSCMNNNYSTSSLDNSVIEDKCSDVNSYEDDMYDGCSCGFDEEYSVFPENPMLAQSYVPIQYMNKTFRPEIGLKMGTIFPELVSPYMPCQDMEQQRFIESMNSIGKGCNK